MQVASLAFQLTNQKYEKAVILIRTFNLLFILVSVGGKRDEELNDSALYMVVKDHLPLSIGEKRGFQRFSHTAVPLWQPPKRGKMTKLMEDKYASLKPVVGGALSQLPSICLTADCWTDSHTTQGYLGMTCHFLLGTEMETAAFGLVHLTEPHEAPYLASKIRSFCDDWDIKNENVSFCVTDNAGNIGNAVKLVFGPYRHINCFDHTLNLVPKSTLSVTKKKDPNEEGKEIILENVPGFLDLVKKMKSVVTYSHNSVNFADELRRIQIEDYKKKEGTALRLIQDVDTRWDATYLMMKRYEEMSNIISAAANKFPNVQILSGQELAEVRSSIKLLSYFHDATNEMSAEKVTTASKAIPIAGQIRKVRHTKGASWYFYLMFC